MLIPSPLLYFGQRKCSFGSILISFPPLSSGQRKCSLGSILIPSLPLYSRQRKCLLPLLSPLGRESVLSVLSFFLLLLSPFGPGKCSLGSILFPSPLSSWQRKCCLGSTLISCPLLSFESGKCSLGSVLFSSPPLSCGQRKRSLCPAITPRFPLFTGEENVLSLFHSLRSLWLSSLAEKLLSPILSPCLPLSLEQKKCSPCPILTLKKKKKKKGVVSVPA